MERELLDSDLVLVVSGTGWIIEQSLDNQLERINRIYVPTDEVYRQAVDLLELKYWVRFEGWVRKKPATRYILREEKIMYRVVFLFVLLIAVLLIVWGMITLVTVYKQSGCPYDECAPLTPAPLNN